MPDIPTKAQKQQEVNAVHTSVDKLNKSIERLQRMGVYVELNVFDINEMGWAFARPVLNVATYDQMEPTERG